MAQGYESFLAPGSDIGYRLSSICDLFPSFALRFLHRALGNALEATSRLGNQRNCLVGRDAPCVPFTRRPGHRDKDTGVRDTLYWAPTSTFNGAYSIAATALV
jgi:hypothetical protein